MNIQLAQGKLDGFVELIPEIYEDDRGFLTRIYDERIFEKAGLPVIWTEESHHHTRKKHTLRGLYVQKPPFSEGKLLRAVRGEMLWVSVDLRKGSSTFGQWDSLILSGEKKNMLCTARGFAHGCVALTDEVDLLIRSDNYFSAEHGIGIVWNDPILAIDWQLNGAIPNISERDKAYPSFEEFQQTYTGGITQDMPTV